MPKKINIAVILSLYRNSKLPELKIAINSIDNQEKNKLDLLICFDGYVNFEIKKFLKNFKCNKSINKIIIYKNIENKGLAYSMNKLILNNFSKYEFFVRHDCDDYSHKNRVNLLVNFLSKNLDIDIVGSASKSFIKSDKRKFYINRFPTQHKDIALAFAYSTAIMHGTVVFRNTFFIKAGLYNSEIRNFTEDSNLWYSALRNNCKFATVKDVLYFVGMDGYQYNRRLKFNLIFTLFFLRINYIVSSKINPIYIIHAFSELLIRLTLSVLSFLKLNKFLFIILLKYKSRKN